jgi:hypothetical protein
VDEHLVPEPRLVVALELGQVVVGAAATPERFGAIVEEVQAEVEQAGRHRRAVHQQPGLDEVPAPRSHEECGRSVVEAVCLALGRVERQLAAHGIGQGRMPTDDVRPGRRERVLEVGHEDARARVERVDHHLRLGRAGDLHSPVVKIRRSRRDRPRRLTHLPGRDREVRTHTGIELALPLLPPLEQVEPRWSEPPLQVGDERQRRCGQDPVRAGDIGALQLDACRQPVHVSPPRDAPSPR